MASTYHYHVIKSSWGVVVDLTAEIGSDVTGAEAVADNVFLRVETPVKLTAEEQSCLVQGLRLVAGNIRACVAPSTNTVTRLLALKYNPCDYQSEGVICAIANWTAREYGFAPPAVRVTFDYTVNRYLFDFTPNVQGEE